MGSPERKSGSPELNLVYHTAGGLPYTLRERSFVRYLKGLPDQYRGVCLLPSRAMEKMGVDAVKEVTEDCGVTVPILEAPWNPIHISPPFDNLWLAGMVGLWGLAQRRMGIAKTAPIPRDALSPGARTSSKLLEQMIKAFPGSRLATYDLRAAKRDPKRTIVGVMPSQVSDLGAFLAEVEKVTAVAFFDPHNLVAAFVRWEDQFKAMAKGRLGMVDVHAIKVSDMRCAWLGRKTPEVADLLRGQGFFPELVAAAKSEGVNILRVEIPIPFVCYAQGLKASMEFLEKIGQALTEAWEKAG